jgi:hypothetical protein
MSAPDRDPRLSTADLAAAPSASERLEREQRDDHRFRAPAPSNDAEVGQERSPLFPDQELEGLRSQWLEIQGRFVDEPRASVEAADHLVASTVQRLAESFARVRDTLEKQWGEGDVSTEDLRQALRRYRSFFDRLLSV